MQAALRAGCRASSIPPSVATLKLQDDGKPVDETSPPTPEQGP